MPSSVICHNYALSEVTWFDINDNDALAPSASARGGLAVSRKRFYSANRTTLKTAIKKKKSYTGLKTLLTDNCLITDDTCRLLHHRPCLYDGSDGSFFFVHCSIINVVSSELITQTTDQRKDVGGIYAIKTGSYLSGSEWEVVHSSLCMCAFVRPLIFF